MIIKTKIKKTTFKKGQSGNPRGKPKGALNKSTIRFAKIRTLASNKYEEAFDMVWKAMLNMEGWAYQIYFKELVPKRIYQPTASIETKAGKGRLEALIKSLSQFTELTHDEILSEIKALNIKNSEIDIMSQQKIERESEEELMNKVYALRKVIEHAETQNKNS